MPPVETDAEMRERMEKLSLDLSSRAKPEGTKATAPLQGPGNIGGAMSLGFRVMSEFVAAVVVSALIGWQADRWLGTSPALLLIFCALGTAAGFWMVYRIAVGGTSLTGRR